MSPRLRLALGVFIVVGVMTRADDPAWHATWLLRLVELATLLVGCAFIGSVAPDPEGQP